MSTLIRFSAGRNKYDNTPKQLAVDDFSDLVDHMETNRGRKKGEYYVCGPMAFGPHNNTVKYQHDAHYKLANHSEPCSFLSMDIDYMDGEPGQQSILREIGQYCAYAYETASSTPEVPRMRVIVQLDREVSRDERIDLGESFQALIEANIEKEFGNSAIKFDKSVYRPEQPNYNPLEGARSWKFLCERPLKVDEILSNSDRSETRAKPSGHSKSTLRGGNLVANLGDVNAHISAYRSGNPAENPFATATQVLKTPFLLAQIKSAFDAIPSDDRKLWIKLGHAAKTLDDDGGDEAKRAWLEWSKKSEKFDLDDAEASWKSFTPTITSHEKIFLMAEDYGWDVQAANANIDAILGETKSPREFEYPDQDFGDLKASTAFNQGQAKSENDLHSDFDLVTYNSQLLEDVKSIPKRDWIIPRLLLGGNISLILGPGGVAKSMLQLIAAVSVATGRDLLRLGPIRKCNVLLVNNEDDRNELQRRVSAVVSQFAIDPAELEGSLYTISGYLRPIRFAYHVDNRVSRGPDLDKIEAFIAERKIEALFVDPFISTHTAPENDNNAMDQVVSIFKRLSGKFRIAINIAHHTKKIGGDTEAHAGDAESGRGASSIKDAARAAVTIARMGKKTAEKIDIPNEVRGDYIRMDVGKMNFAPHDSKANWFRIKAVRLENGDTVGVPVPENLDAQFAKAQDGRKKWTPETMAMAVSNLFPGTEGQVPWADVKARYMNEHGVGTSVAGNNITLLPQEGDAAIRVRGYDIWISRTAPRNGWMLHRKGVFDA